MTSNPYGVNVENMRKWIKDLRTTTAPQVDGTLSTAMGPGDDGTEVIGYCCLGRQAACVLGEAEMTDLFLPVFPGGLYKGSALPRWKTLGHLATEETNLVAVFGTDRKEEVDTVVLSTFNDEFYPDEDDEGRLHILSQTVTAAEANDDLHWPFSKIADALEARYLPDDWATTMASRTVTT